MSAVDLGIAGERAVVTAATRGIGLAIARALAAEGARVAVVARTPEAVREVAAELGGVPVVADLTTEAGCESAADQVHEALGPVSILVNNLGLRVATSWADTGVDEVEAALAGNLYPAIRLTRRLLPEMAERGWGRVLVVSSLFGREAGGAPAYNVAKAAEHSFVTSLGREVAARGVTVNAVAPGSVLFEGGSWHRRREADPAAIDEFVRREMPLGRFGTPEEVAAVAAFLCSRAAAYVNAAVVAVDGGQGRSLV